MKLQNSENCVIKDIIHSLSCCNTHGSEDLDNFFKGSNSALGVVELIRAVPPVETLLDQHGVTVFARILINYRHVIFISQYKDTRITKDTHLLHNEDSIRYQIVDESICGDKYVKIISDNIEIGIEEYK